MPKIKNIQRDITVTGTDKLFGTDVSGVTRNYLVSDIVSFGNLGTISFTYITAVGGSHTVNLLASANNYNISAINGANSISFTNLDASTVGKSGTIVITNPSSVGSLSWTALPATVYTPGGGTITFDTTADKIAVLNYFVASTTKILVNYVGNFGAYPQ